MRSTREATERVPGSTADVRLLIPALATWVIVALCIGRGALLPAGAAGVALVAALVLLLRARRADTGDRGGPSLRGWMLGLTLCGGLLVITAGAEARAEVGPVSELAAEKASVRITGRVMAEPRRLRLTEAGPPRVAVLVDVFEIEGRGHASRVETPVLVMGGAEWVEVGWRQTVSARGRLVPAEPGDRVRAVLPTSTPPEVSAPAGPIVAIADRARDATRAVVHPLPEDPRGLVPAMIIGDKDGVPDDLADAMRATGMTHLTAVSGTNCSLVVAAAWWVCGLCLVPRRLRPVIGGCVLAGFVVLARPDPSVIRAACMGGIGLLGFLRSRRQMGLPALAATVLVLLAVDPWLSRSYGFALSVLATLGLLVLARPWSEALRRRAPLGPVAEALAMPLAAQVMCAPVVVLLQGEVSLVGVLANALVVPLVAPVTILGAVVTVLAVPWPWAATAVAWTAAVPAWGIAQVARLAERAPLRALPWRDDPAGAVTLAALLAGVVLFGAAVWRWGRRRARTVLLVGVLAVALLGAVSYVRSRTGFPGSAPALVMCDVGQGDALVAVTGPRHAVVVDAGPDPGRLDSCLDRLDVEVVDAVILTHFDTDHVGGLSGLDRGRAVGDVVVSAASLSEVPPAVRRWWDEHGRPVHPVSQGDGFVWGQVAALVRGPRRSAAGLTPNAGSLVLDLVVAGEDGQTVRALLLADADTEAGDRVRADLRGHPEAPGVSARGDAPPFDVVKVAHHGSAHQSAALLRVAAAPVALISVGADNTYGHPAPRLLDVVRSAGSVVYRSDRDGSVAIRKQGGRLLVTRERGD